LLCAILPAFPTAGSLTFHISLPAESRGVMLEVEVIDAATGASLGKNWSVVG
jgi:hypothetical protein